MLRVPCLATSLLLLASGCQSAPRPIDALQLPHGDPQAGQEAFVELRCHSCHRVTGVDLPEPVARPPVDVELGGADAERIDAGLVTAIVNPSHGGVRDMGRRSVQSGSLSRMGDFSEAMTVRQLIDVIAFLRSRSSLAPAATTLP